MSEIINIYMCEEFIKRREKIPLAGWDQKIPTRLHRFTTEEGTLNVSVLGGKQKTPRILVI